MVNFTSRPEADHFPGSLHHRITILSALDLPFPQGFIFGSSSRPGADHFSGPLHHRSTILSALGLPFPHGFVFGNLRATSQWVTHHGIALTPFSLNFEVLTESKASELPKGLVLGRDVNIHLRITPLGDVGCHNPPSLGARRPRRHTRDQG